jgi:hypothetical protein
MWQTRNCNLRHATFFGESTNITVTVTPDLIVTLTLGLTLTLSLAGESDAGGPVA